MANEDLTVRLKADDQLTPKVKEATKAVEKLEDTKVELELDADVSRVLTALEDVTAETKATAEAAEVLGRALGPELAAKADTTAIVGDLKNMGLSLDQIKGNADELAAKMRELSDADVGGKLGSSLGTARGQIDDLGKSADSSKSVLANMVGNATQDIGALGGVAGSAGVAFGQMGEYIADAAAGGDSFKQIVSGFGAVLGPLLGIMAATQTLSGYMATQARRAEESASRIDLLGAAMQGAADDALGLAEGLRDSMEGLEGFDATSILGGTDSIINKLNDVAKAIPIIGGLAQDLEVDVAGAMGAAGASMYDFSRAVTGTTEVGQAFLDQMYAAMKAGKISGDEYRALSQAVSEYRDAAAEATEDQKLFNVNAEEANAILAKSVDPMSQMQDVWQKLMADMADGSIDTEAAADAVNELALKLGLTREEVLGLAGAQLDKQMQEDAAAAEEAYAAMQQLAEGVKAFSDATGSIEFGLADTAGALTAMGLFNDMLFAQDNQIAANIEAFDALSESVKTNGANFDVNTEAGRANQSALEGVARALEDELAAAYADANGNQEVFEQTAGKLAHDTLARLQSELGLSAEETFALGKELGLLPEDLQTRYELSGTEEAKQKIGLLQTSIDALPKDVQTKVTQQIIAGDYQGALNTIQSYYSSHPATVKANADTGGAERELNNLTRDRTVTIRVRGIPQAVEMGGTVGPDGGIAGEAGPEFIRLPDGRKQLLTGPAFVPPRTQVTSTKRTRALLARGQLPRYANGTGVNTPGGQVDMIWKQILFSLDALTALTAEGNDTAEDVGRMLAAVDLAEATAEQTKRISNLLMDLNDEMRSGNQGGQEAIDNMKAALSTAIMESAMLTGVVRFEDGSFGPENPAWVKFEDGSFGPVVDAISSEAKATSKATSDKVAEVKIKEDPNTPFLRDIKQTLLEMASHDRSASAQASNQLYLLLSAVSALQSPDVDSAVRAAAMTIRAGRA